MPPLQHEIGKKRPFDEPTQELFLAIMRTAAVLEADGAQLFRDAELSGATYNVLRILRGATIGQDAPGEVTCGHIARHLVSPVPDVTRLIDRLEKAGLAERKRSSSDRRVVYVRVTAAGLKLLAELAKAGVREPLSATCGATPSTITGTGLPPGDPGAPGAGRVRSAELPTASRMVAPLSWRAVLAL